MLVRPGFSPRESSELSIFLGKTVDLRTFLLKDSRFSSWSCSRRDCLRLPTVLAFPLLMDEEDDCASACDSWFNKSHTWAFPLYSKPTPLQNIKELLAPEMTVQPLTRKDLMFMPETPYLPAFGVLDLNFLSIYFLFLKVVESCNDNIPQKKEVQERRGDLKSSNYTVASGAFSRKWRRKLNLLQE